MLNQISGGVYLTFLNILITVFWVYTCLSFGLSRSIFLFSILFLSLLYEIILNLSIQFIVFFSFICNIKLHFDCILCIVFIVYIFNTILCNVGRRQELSKKCISYFLSQKDRLFCLIKTNQSVALGQRI